jgi:hypothetical protein
VQHRSYAPFVLVNAAGDDVVIVSMADRCVMTVTLESEFHWCDMMARIHKDWRECYARTLLRRTVIV